MASGTNLDVVKLVVTDMCAMNNLQVYWGISQ